MVSRFLRRGHDLEGDGRGSALHAVEPEPAGELILENGVF